MVKRRVNWETGLLASSDTPEDATITIEKYWTGTEPTEFDTKEIIEELALKAITKEAEDSQISEFFDF